MNNLDLKNKKKTYLIEDNYKIYKKQIVLMINLKDLFNK